MAARVLDVHSVHNVAFARTEFKLPAFYDTIRWVRAVADEPILQLPADVPLVVTEVLTHGSPWADECWARLESASPSIATARPRLTASRP